MDIQLPESYKLFISQYNEANFIYKYHFAYKKGKGYLNSNKRKHTQTIIGLSHFLDFNKIEKEIYFIENDIIKINPKEIIPIIEEFSDTNYFLLYTKKDKNYGKVYFADESSDYSFETLYYMAENFEQFLQGIIDEKTRRKIDDL